VFRGRYQRDGYALEKWGLQGEGDYIIPMLLFIPEGAGPFPAIVYTHPENKVVEAMPGGQIEQLVGEGFVVAAADLLGFGETAFLRSSGHGPIQPFYNALLAGRSVPGINAGDALRVFDFLRGRPDVQPRRVGAVAIGATGPAMLHAAAVEADLAWLVLSETLQSYESIVLNELYKVNGNSLVAGALTAYDLPDLLASLAPRPVALVNATDHMGEPVTEDAARAAASFPTAAYQNAGAGEKLRILAGPDANLVEIVAWCAHNS
jgi:dienelactone hydrolase